MDLVLLSLGLRTTRSRRSGVAHAEKPIPPLPLRSFVVFAHSKASYSWPWLNSGTFTSGADNMPGDRGLRSELGDASTILVPTEYRARLGNLKERYGHAIRILPDGASQIRRFNCFAYALGIWCCPRYKRLVDAMQSSVLVNSAFVQGLLANGELSEVRHCEVSRGDVALHFLLATSSSMQDTSPPRHLI
jgi:hypothetical protein